MYQVLYEAQGAIVGPLKLYNAGWLEEKKSNLNERQGSSVRWHIAHLRYELGGDSTIITKPQFGYRLNV